jgi:hypothetical protein
MADTSDRVTVALRIPGQWSQPRELVERLPADCHLTPEALVLPDGTRVEFGVVEADDQFAEIFRSSCRQPPTVDEQRVADDYSVNVLLSGPGGSLTAAHTMMQAAAAIVRAGGAGVFIDNCGLAHGGQNWLAMTAAGGPEALSFAFVGIVRGKTEISTMGMHVLGLRDLVMKRSDVEVEGFDMIDLILYVCRGEKPIENGHLLADLDGPRFQAFLQESPPPQWPDSPMHNPFGQIRLVSLQDIAATN